MTRILLAVSLISLAVLAEDDEKRPRRPDPDEAKAAIAERDGDGDGRLSESEFGGGARLFKLLDRNRDGFLSTDDLLPPPPKREGAAGAGGAGEPGPRDQAMRLLKESDKNGDGKLSKDEYPAGARVEFAKADANGDGFVDALEVAQLVDRQGKRPEGGLDRLKKLKEQDANGDGRIDRAEWKGPPEMFDRADADKDGALSKEEIQEAVRRLAPDGAGGKLGGAMFRRQDADGDGKISRGEWKMAADLFDRLDTNKDGFLEMAEVQPKGPGRGWRGGGDGDGFFAQLDKNRDGKVTKDEFADERKFAEMDADGNGELSAPEVSDAMAKRRKEAAYDFVEKNDLNGDGKVTREEFAGAAAAFESADRNHDGVVDAADKP